MCFLRKIQAELFEVEKNMATANRLKNKITRKVDF